MPILPLLRAAPAGGALSFYHGRRRAPGLLKRQAKATTHQRNLKKNITKYNKAQCNVNVRVTPKPQNGIQQRNAIPKPQRKTAVYHSGTSGLLGQAFCLALFLAFFEPGALFFKRDAGSFADAEHIAKIIALHKDMQFLAPA